MSPGGPHRGSGRGLPEEGKFKTTLCVFEGRTPQVSDVLQQKFTQLCLDNGILPDNIAILPQNGM